MMLVRLPMTNLKMTMLTMLFLYVANPPPYSVYKSSYPLLVSGGNQPLDRCLPSPSCRHLK